MTDTLHASAVRLKAGGVLLLGAAGSGKSSLAMHLIDQYGGQLIADDRVELTVSDARLRAAPPENLAGMLELRGLGIVTLAYCAAPLDLAVELVARADVPRLAEPFFFTHQTSKLPCIKLHGHDVASAAIIARALAVLPQNGFSPDGVYR